MNTNEPNRSSISCLVVLILASTLAWSYQFVSFHDAKMVALWGGAVVLFLSQHRALANVATGLRIWFPAGIGLLVLGFGSILWSHVPSLAFAEFLRTTGLLLVAVLAYGATRHETGRKAVLSAIVGAAFLASILALAQRAGYLEALFPSYPHYDQSMYSVFGNEGLLGGYLAFALVLLPGVVAGTADWRRCLMLSIVAIIIVIALIASASRAGYIALVAGILTHGVLAHRRYRWRWNVGGGIVLSILLIVIALELGVVEKWRGLFSSGDVGAQVRLWIGRASLDLVTVHPFTGVGLGNYAYWIPRHLGDVVGGYHNETTTYHAHFDALEFYCETGILGLIVVGWQLARLRLRNAVAMSGLVSLVVFSCFYPVWASPPHALAGLLLLGMNFASPRDRRTVRVTAIQQRRAWCLTGWVLFPAAALYCLSTLYPSYLLCRAENIHLAGGDARDAYRSATEGVGFRGEANESFGIYLYQSGD